jgi:hypothetical protein
MPRAVASPPKEKGRNGSPRGPKRYINVRTLAQLRARRAARSRWTIAPGEVIALACDLYRAGFGTLDDCLSEARAWIARRSRREASR